MKPIFSVLIIIITLLLTVNNSSTAQGCVAIRSTGGVCTAMEHPDANNPNADKKWSMLINNRYFRSFRHFAGKEEQKQRVDSGTEVINHSYTMDIAVSKHFNNRWSVALDVPIVSNSRSSLYEHDRIHRYSTHSFGVGDVRLTAYRWLLNPEKSMNFNVQLGLGLKLPTGDYRYTDKFHVSDTSTVLGPVDQSIQLGDGGTGITTEVNAFYNLNHALSIYGNFYYLSNPREQNGVSTARGGTPSTTAVQYGSDVMSVPDQYLIRGGFNYTNKKFIASAGVRYERLPAKDIIGGSEGFRRPGYILSIEPGVTYSFKALSLYAYVPVAIERNRIQSVPDMHRTQITHSYYVGDAAFADYTVNIGLAFKL